MAAPVIHFNNISKQYRLGQLGTGTISHDINKWWSKLRGKEDPYLKVGEVNVKDTLAKSGYVWALRNINEKIYENEIVGIIGRNGAGKSTLLKILSRITSPTQGEIYLRGKIASLLEVGTGFHPELTGRENIFLNGAILGMTKAEIKLKFDEIVTFSGIAKYIDTPVKRYSSGMIVRLGFAIAAHLEPDILIVDEVLAVGDVDFQQKCISKMNDVSKQGRTILFVSHNMSVIQQLCTRAIYLHNGEINYSGSTKEAINYYLTNSAPTNEAIVDLINFPERRGNSKIIFTQLQIKNNNETQNTFQIGNDVQLFLSVKKNTDISLQSLAISIYIYSYSEELIANIENIDSNFKIDEIENEATFKITINNINLYPGKYKLGFWMGSQNYAEMYDLTLFCATFEIMPTSPLVYRSLSNAQAIIYYTPTWEKIT